MNKSLTLGLLLIAIEIFQTSPALFAQTVKETPFAKSVKEHFAEWDRNGDGVLSKDEIYQAVTDQKVRDESAAAIVAIVQVVRQGNKFKLPLLTKDYLVLDRSRNQSTINDSNDSADEDTESDNSKQPPSFQSLYNGAIKKIRGTSRELFSHSLPAFEAVSQGHLGDCPFVSTVGAMVYRNPSEVKAMFTTNENGSTTVSFGNGQKINVHNLTDSDIAIWSSAGTDGLWLTILEKAYRRVILAEKFSDQKDKPNIYEKTGGSIQTIEILAGHEKLPIGLHKIKSGSAEFAALRKDMIAVQNKHRLIKAATPEGKRTPGITPGHAYAVLSFDAKTDLVHVWNPHGNNFTPKGPDGLQNGYTTKRGEFGIPLKDLIQIFSDVDFETENPARN